MKVIEFLNHKIKSSNFRNLSVFTNAFSLCASQVEPQKLLKKRRESRYRRNIGASNSRQEDRKGEKINLVMSLFFLNKEMQVSRLLLLAFQNLYHATQSNS